MWQGRLQIRKIWRGWLSRKFRASPDEMFVGRMSACWLGFIPSRLRDGANDERFCLFFVFRFYGFFFKFDVFAFVFFENLFVYFVSVPMVYHRLGGASTVLLPLGWPFGLLSELSGSFAENADELCC